MIALIVIYIILAAFVLVGTGIGEDTSIWVTIIYCIVLGWLFAPIYAAYVFGKYLAYTNSKY